MAVFTVGLRFSLSWMHLWVNVDVIIDKMIVEIANIFIVLDFILYVFYFFCFIFENGIILFFYFFFIFFILLAFGSYVI